MNPEKPESNKGIAEKIVGRLKSLSADWKSGDPGEIKRSTSEDPHWKIRRAWFQLVGGEFEMMLRAIDQGQLSLSASLIEQVHNANEIIFNELAHRDPTEADVSLTHLAVELVIHELGGTS